MEETVSIAKEVRSSPDLRPMIDKSMKAYKHGKAITTSEFVKSLSPADFQKELNKYGK
ncbi:hypothetical protein [Paenibacillus elgii]|uniref:hypothetical protein n=1 Tax=Paenibacillus elgii TaxID=189691 RepID=UPI00203BFDC1|nr:hypothetical protein [Paenibacillus elgii]MCM3271884.1 hypothetical protein [Paenibacillus elgii]